MQNVTTTIIGAGQAGLAMSRCLTDRSIEHVVLERAQVANSWANERWDSLRLLTPNWMTRLPGFSYEGGDPEGYMTAAEVRSLLQRYRASFDAPVQRETAVHRVSGGDGRFMVETSQGLIESQTVVVATGACSVPSVPSISLALPADLYQVAPIHYRNPESLPPGAVMVVGASASGIQLADEIARGGRRVILATGEHTRLPRSYRGMNIHWWMDQLGLLDQRHNEVEDITRARRLPSLQLVGSPDQRTLDLNAVQAVGVEVVGRLVGYSNGKLQFAGSLANQCVSADLKQGRLLDEIDAHAAAHGLDAELGAPDRPAPTRIPTPSNTLGIAEISSVVWATGFRPDYPWLDDRLLDAKGGITHDGGVMAQAGMYVLGLPFLRRRKSSFVDGVGCDASEIAAHLRWILDLQAAKVPSGT